MGLWLSGGYFPIFFDASILNIGVLPTCWRDQPLISQGSVQPSSQRFRRERQRKQRNGGGRWGLGRPCPPGGEVFFWGRGNTTIRWSGFFRKSSTGWLIGGLEHGFYEFPFSWEVHNPNWRNHIFQRGRYTTKQMISLNDLCWFIWFPMN